MSKSNYILINQQFATKYHGYSNGSSIFASALTADGRYVTSVNSLTEFPVIFTGELSFPGIVIVELDTSDFPPQIIFPT